MSFDWDDILSSTGEAPTTGVIPPGKYDTRVKEAKVENAGTGKVMIAMVLTIDGGPHDDEYLWNNIVFPDATSKPGHQKMFFRALNALGFSNEFLTTNRPAPAQLAELMEGRSVVANVINKVWEGEDRAEVKSLHPAGSVSDTPPVPVVGDSSGAETPPPPPVVDVPPPPPVLPDDTDNDDDDEAPF